MSWALSCLQLRQFYDEVELVTDSQGAELLINKLHLPYTSCKTTLDNLSGKNPAIWAIGKIYAYEEQEKPFIHVDGDIYIWKPFPTRVENAGILAQNVEKNYPYNINLLNEMLDKKFSFPFQPSLGDMCEANMGITGGHDLYYFKDYCSLVYRFLDLNSKQLEAVESTSKCKIIIFFCRTRILVFENLVFVLAFCFFSSVSLQFFCL